MTTSWIDSLPEGTVRDTAIRTSLPSFQHADIEQAFRLSEALNDADLRQSGIQSTLETWIPTDPQAAYRALENTVYLTEPQKEVITAALSRMQEDTKDFLLPAPSN